MTRRVLICANPDLNYIDGSSIWAQTIALACAATGQARVDFIAKSPPQRDELFAALKAAPSLNIIDGAASEHWQGKRFARLSLPKMAELAVMLDRDDPYDVIIIRGYEIATALLDSPHVLAKTWLYLTDIPQDPGDFSPAARRTMHQLAHGCGRLLCQTDGFRDLWQALVPDLPGEKISLYTPVIPDPPGNLPALADRPVQAIYAGKFKGDWMTLEMAEAWPAICDAVPGAELVMIGDKIHEQPGDPDYRQRMQQRLENTPGLTWLGALSREATQSFLQQARVGLSWRSEAMNDTVEYSTKILEYGGAGCGAILNRNPLHERLLGSDYPLFANTSAEFQQQVIRALTDLDTATRAADALGRLAWRHSFSTRVAEIADWLVLTPKAAARPARTRVLVAGHDLKFFLPLQKRLEATGQFEFLVDQWQGHDRHDEAQSLALLQQADVIFCEWCLGNVRWYSHHKHPHQRLVARFHLQELLTKHLNETDLSSVDHIGFVSDHTRAEALQTFNGLTSERSSVIPNFLDDQKFLPEQKTAEARYTIGMIGVTPMRKRIDRAIDLLEALLAEDDRFCLRIKGKNPLDYGWLLRREDELSYYRAMFERINSDPKLRYKVIFDPAGDDINDWFKMVGFILSPSDHESFHMAIGEGMLTGAKPIIWNWQGAAEIWGSQWVIASVDEAKAAVLSADPAVNLDERLKMTQHAQDVVSQWQKIILGDRALHRQQIV